MYGLVRTIDWLNPSYVSLVLGGEGLRDFKALPATDAYVNVAIPPEGASYATPFDLEALKGLPREERPFRRRYTVRRWDESAGELTLEIVVHGDEGAGGRWVSGAKPGDALVFTGPAGNYRPDPQADWHLFVGDESALPAIAASLAALPPDKNAVARLICNGPEYEIPLSSPGALDMAWIHREGAAQDDSVLVKGVAGADLPAGTCHAFVHGEAAETRAVRRYLLADLGVDPAHLSCSPYWRRGYNDEAWRQVKAAWNAEVAADVPTG